MGCLCTQKVKWNGQNRVERGLHNALGKGTEKKKKSEREKKKPIFVLSSHDTQMSKVYKSLQTLHLFAVPT